jgi:hypothetical protein
VPLVRTGIRIGIVLERLILPLRSSGSLRLRKGLGVLLLVMVVRTGNVCFVFASLSTAAPGPCAVTCLFVVVVVVVVVDSSGLRLVLLRTFPCGHVRSREDLSIAVGEGDPRPAGGGATDTRRAVVDTRPTDTRREAPCSRSDGRRAGVRAAVGDGDEEAPSGAGLLAFVSSSVVVVVGVVVLCALVLSSADGATRPTDTRRTGVAAAPELCFTLEALSLRATGEGAACKEHGQQSKIKRIREKRWPTSMLRK